MIVAAQHTDFLDTAMEQMRWPIPICSGLKSIHRTSLLNKRHTILDSIFRHRVTRDSIKSCVASKIDTCAVKSRGCVFVVKLYGCVHQNQKGGTYLRKSYWFKNVTGRRLQTRNLKWQHCCVSEFFQTLRQPPGGRLGTLINQDNTRRNLLIELSTKLLMITLPPSFDNPLTQLVR